MNSGHQIQGKVVLITGASSGLGRHFAKVLANEGALVVLASRQVERLKEIRAEIEGLGGDADIIELDVRRLKSIRAAVAHVETTYGRIDVLINNSGVTYTHHLEKATEEEFDDIIDTNLRGAFFMAQEVAKHMIVRAKGAIQRGENLPVARIINMASVAGMTPHPHIGLYGISKAAVIHMTKSMAMEWGQYGINTNAICAGFINTDATQTFWKSRRGQSIIKHLPRQRIGSMNDLDGILLLLSGSGSNYINGALITVDDGVSRGITINSMAS